MAADVTFEAPSWDQIYQMTLNQAQKIQKSHYNEYLLVAVSRVGWVPARIFSDLLDNHDLASVKAENYVGVAKVKAEPKLTQPLSLDVSGKRVLVVDDVADSGKSLQLVVNHILERGAVEVKTVTLYYKPTSTFKPDFYEKETQSWIVFPWDLKETLNELAASPTALERLVKAGVSKQLIDRLLELKQ
jgi:hypoxanthine phosphoribosyltransferase